MKTPRLFRTSLALSIFAATGAAQAQAPGFALNRFDPSERGSDWFVLESLDFRGTIRPAAGLVLDWANKPLVVYAPNGDERAALVENQVFLHAGGSLVMWDRVRFALDMPVAVHQSGQGAVVGTTTYAAPDKASAGDLRLGFDALVVGRYLSPFELGLGVQFHAPTGDRAAYTGDAKSRIAPHILVAGIADALQYAAKLGIEYRAQDQAFADSPMGSNLTFGGALGVRIADQKLVVGPEIWGTTNITESDAFFSRRSTPLEALLGAHYTVASDWKIGGGAGLGLTRGFGAPKVRLVLSAEWAPAYHEEAPPPPPPPPPPPAPPPDRDGDSVLDPEDACPDTPGVRTADPKINGCPPDRDNDGISDADDACPDVPGVKTEDPKTNGCPPDRDGDGVPDEHDACPDVPGVKTEDPKTNGCPPDRDKDSIIDPEDACPDVPGEKDPDPKKNGCPPARVEAGEIKITQQVKFKLNSAVILPESDGILGAVATILKEHPEIDRVRVEGHTDDKGTAAYNNNLSTRRAAAVATWLTKHGIEKTRLSSKGFGRTRPIDSNTTDEGRQNNRRVEFHIEEKGQKPEKPEEKGQKPEKPSEKAKGAGEKKGDAAPP
jgi:outer membrane protein OmpA-like peptidoglycan-associated protein